MSEYHTIRVSVAASDDLNGERVSLTSAIEDVNLELRAQVIGVQLEHAPSNPDILIVAVWKRIDPEIEDRVRRSVGGQSLHGPRYVTVFFNQQPHTPIDQVGALQWAAVLALHSDLSRFGSGVDYHGNHEFAQKVASYLTKYALEIALSRGLLDIDLPTLPEGPAAEIISGEFACTVVPTELPTIRSEGFSELVGELGLLFSGDLPQSHGGKAEKLRLELYFNTAVTNRIQGSHHGDVFVVRVGMPHGNPPIQGHIVGNRVEFHDVVVDPPGKGDPVAYAIQNIRVNATSLGGSRRMEPAPVVASLRIVYESGEHTDLTGEVVALVRRSLTFSVLPVQLPAPGKPSRMYFLQDAPADAECVGLLRFEGLLPQAFKTALEERGTAVNAEPSGGTRMKVTFNNIPEGVHVFVSVSEYPSEGRARLIVDEGEPYSEWPPTASFYSVLAAELPITQGSATAVWEVIKSDQERNDVYQFVVFIEYTPQVELNLPPPGTATVNASFAPTPRREHSGRLFTASKFATACDLPVPRFVADPEAARNLFQIEIHRTRLRFTLVISRDGLDTAITISNVTLDPSGTPPQAGSAVLYFFGSGAPSPVNTGTIPAGQTYSILMSSIALGFQGYVVAVCHFYPARGYAMIISVGWTGAGNGYLAEVLEP